MKVNFSENLKMLRLQNNVTQQDIAELCKTTTATVSRWENGVNEPDIYNLILLADYFEITIDELVK
ncbi:MAG TPA: XRE family transcriptional regulator [Clostridiales bacterium]|nr:XRE family transcriptional regulator [Clostridiales bacterium]